MQSYQRIQHTGHTDFNTSGTNGPRGGTGASPPSATAQSCATSEITLYAVFVTPDSATLLYTYISRFFVNPQHQQKRIIRQSCHHKFYPQPLFNFSYNRPTFAFTSESGYTTRLSAKDRTQRLTRRNRGRFGWGRYYYPRSISHVSETLRGQVSERQTLSLWGLGRRHSRRTQRACGTVMRLCASLFRRRRGPAGLRDLFRFWRNRDLYIRRS